MQTIPPLRDQSGKAMDDAAERQLSVSEFVAELDALILELESAKDGSQTLDIRLHYGFRVLGGYGKDMASLLIKEGISWPTVQATLNEIVPAYTTSLDAALQGEQIVFTIRSATGHRWGAMQRTSSGGEELGWAATEPLARRLAALMSWRAELKKSLEDADIVPNPTRDYRTEPDSADDNKGNTNHDMTSSRENPQHAQHDISERVQHDISERVQHDISERVQHDISERVQHDISERVQHDISERVQQDNPEQSDRKEKGWEVLF